MYKDAVNKLIELEKTLVSLGGVQRADYWPTSPRRSRETDIEHSYSLAMASWQLASALGLQLNHEKILKYALIHDLPEVYAGDTPLFSTNSKHDEQADKEAAAIARLRQQFPESDLVETLESFYAQRDEESKFVKAMDKLVALLVHIVSEETQFIDNKITSEDIERVLPKWRSQTDISEAMAKVTDQLLMIWYEKVKLYQ
jgi:putative hydrolase of HD superfamily